MSLNRRWRRLNYLPERSPSVRNLVNTWSCSSSSLESREFGSSAYTSRSPYMFNIPDTCFPHPSSGENIATTLHWHILPPKNNPISILHRQMSWDLQLRLWCLVSVWLCFSKLAYSALDSWRANFWYFLTISLFLATRSTFEQQLEIANI